MAFPVASISFSAFLRTVRSRAPNIESLVFFWKMPTRYEKLVLRARNISHTTIRFKSKFTGPLNVPGILKPPTSPPLPSRRSRLATG
jgi:hypothetical protein